VPLGGLLVSFAAAAEGRVVGLLQIGESCWCAVAADDIDANTIRITNLINHQILPVAFGYHLMTWETREFNFLATSLVPPSFFSAMTSRVGPAGVGHFEAADEARYL
jgi:hypothetical protein